MTDRPLVSICIPTYRGAEFLGTTIASALAQTHADLEVWVVDDLSPDHTAEVVAAIADPRVRYVRNETNLGPNGNWNRCIELATGKYFKLLPHDDLLEPTSIADHVAVLEADDREKVALVFGSRTIIDHRGKVIMRRGLKGAGTGRIPSSELVRRCVRSGTNIIGEPGNGLIRRSLAQRVGPYDAQNPYLVDLDYWFRVLAHGDGHYVDRPSSCFRVSPTQWSVALGNKQFRDFKGLIERFAGLPAFGITRIDKAIGYAKSRAMMYARGMLYRWLFARAT